jgi:hypothetical protein
MSPIYIQTQSGSHDFFLKVKEETLDEIIKWCYLNLSDKNTVVADYGIRFGFNFHLSTRELDDVLLFKLRWFGSTN